MTLNPQRTERVGGPSPASSRRSPVRTLILSTFAVLVAIVIFVTALSFVASRFSSNGGAAGPGGTAPSAGQSAGSGTRGGSAGSSQQSAGRQGGVPDVGTVTIPPLGGATKSVDGVPVGYPRNASGAVAAGTNYLSVLFGSTAVFDPARRQRVIAALADPAHRAQVSSTVGSAADRAGKALGLDAGGNLPPGAGTLALRVIPIGWRADALSSTNAAVSVWYLSMTGVASPSSTFPVEASWRIATVTLVWVSGDWKFVSVDDRAGPQPVMAAGSSGASDANGMSQALNGFTPYSYGSTR